MKSVGVRVPASFCTLTPSPARSRPLVPSPQRKVPDVLILLPGWRRFPPRPFEDSFDPLESRPDFLELRYCGRELPPDPAQGSGNRPEICENENREENAPESLIEGELRKSVPCLLQPGNDCSHGFHRNPRMRHDDGHPGFHRFPHREPSFYRKTVYWPGSRANQVKSATQERPEIKGAAAERVRPGTSCLRVSTLQLLDSRNGGVGPHEIGAENFL